MDQSFITVKYGVGIDMGKDSFYACISVIDGAQRIKIKATHSFVNTPKGLVEFHRWADHHCKERGVPIHYLMEATGVYYEQLALSLHQRGSHVCVVLPAPAARPESQALHQGIGHQDQDRWGRCSGTGDNGVPTKPGKLAPH